VFGAEAQREFWIKLDDLAHEICALLERIEHSAGGAAPAPVDLGSVYLAETTGDLREQRDIIRRDLQQQGYTVVPAEPLPHVHADLAAAVRADLARCRMSIHLLGRNYSLIPEGGSASLVEIQNELAIERGTEGNFPRLLWIPQGLEVTDARQQAVLESIRMDPRLAEGSDVLETYLEDFRTLVQARLEGARAAEAPAPVSSGAPATTASATPQADSNARSVYLIYDQRDADAAAAWADILFEQQIEVLNPVFDGDEAEIREYHDETLRTCTGVVIFHGAATEVWLRRKMRELQKCAGYGRTLPPPALAICLLAPRTPEKERFRTHEGLVLRGWDGASPDTLGPFIARLRGGDEGHNG
jgi:hypothetical protein